jgi:flagellar protein FlaJ
MRRGLSDESVDFRSHSPNLERITNLSERIFSPYYRKHKSSGREKVELLLRKARSGLSYDQYMSLATLMQIAFAVVSLIAGMVLAILFHGFLIVIVSAMFLANVIALAILLEIPNILVAGRRKDIDSMLTLSIGFFATMSSSGLTIDQMMKIMSENRLYGAISSEARLIYLKSSLFGMDILNSMKETSRTCASMKFSDLKHI